MSKIFSYIKENYRETAIVATITLFALILRLILLNNYGDLWLDELYSWYFSSQNNVFTTVSKLLLQDIHMPLYFVILHFWIKLFGQSDISMHLCTLTLTLPLIPLSFYLIKKLFNKTSAYFSAIFLALNTWCMYYSLEVRFYGMVFVLSLLSAFS
ncbi:MAG: glycosyltransferase family 39 protein, partial [Candidatus Gastranaerophilaceae bacterium]